MKHYIDTGDPRPIKQRIYGPSHYQCNKIEKQVKKILQNGIIKPSVSPCVSPVVLVRKTDKTV